MKDLCVKFGFCLPPDAGEELCANPPGDPKTFTLAVYAAEGLDPTHDRKLYRQVEAFVAQAFARVTPNEEL